MFTDFPELDHGTIFQEWQPEKNASYASFSAYVDHFSPVKKNGNQLLPQFFQYLSKNKSLISSLIWFKSHGAHKIHKPNPFGRPTFFQAFASASAAAKSGVEAAIGLYYGYICFFWGMSMEWRKNGNMRLVYYGLLTFNGTMDCFFRRIEIHRLR